MLFFNVSVRGTADQNHSPWPGTIVDYLHELSDKRGPSNECRSDKLPPTGRIWEKSKGERRHQPICPTNVPESLLESVLAEQRARHQEGP